LPFIGLPSNSHKLEGMVEDAGLDSALFISEKNIADSVSQLLSCIDVHSYLERSQEYTNYAKSSISKMFSDILELG
jgi:hypothetical protein